MVFKEMIENNNLLIVTMLELVIVLVQHKILHNLKKCRITYFKEKEKNKKEKQEQHQ